MIIQKIDITKFRGFENISFELGSQLTAIAGLNGTQKTTILGLLSQPFSITQSENPMKGEKPLCGGNYKSAFNEKFKLSEKFDLPKSHEWTLYINGEEEPFTLESIPRQSGGIRFWRKGNREKGSGYIQLPTIYLSLKRLIPIGEDLKLNESPLQELSAEEDKFFKEWHSKILISQDEIVDSNYIESPDKNTRGINTTYYDWRQNSSGQDNIGKILLAILSFKQLKEKYPNDYKGGLLVIDELDAALYPGSQVKLIEALRKFASKFDIQIIFTTHSLTILESLCTLKGENLKKEATAKQVNVVYLEKRNSKVEIFKNVTFNTIKHRLNVTIEGSKKTKIQTFTEDKEAAIFAKCLLKTKANVLSFVDCTIGHGSLIDLATRKVPSFVFPNSITILDGDVRDSSASMKKTRQLNNFLVLPGDHSPERLLADFLYNLDDNSPVWGSINPNFTKHYCFRDYNLHDIQSDRVKAKAWFNSHLEHWGRNASKVINPWIETNKELADKFTDDFVQMYSRFAKELGLPLIVKQ